MKIQLLVDNPNSWVLPYANALCMDLLQDGHQAKIILKHKNVESGDILCLLSCEQKFKKLNLNKHNLVVHESNLPKGRGWSPITWQVLSGNNKIPISLFEAAEEIDAGCIYLQDMIELNGQELLSEIKEKQGIMTIKLIKSFIDNYPNNKCEAQQGIATYFPRRFPNDSRLDINKSLKEQFNLFRVVDNERYPAFFILDGVKYIVKIDKHYEDDENRQ